MPSVLFVCTANRFRSPLAAAIFRSALLDSRESGNWQVASAGTWTMPGQPVILYLQDVALSMGLDLSGHRSVSVDEMLLSAYDLILVMEPGQKEALQIEFPSLQEKIHLLSNVVEGETYEIPDSFRSERQVTEIATLLRSLIFKGYRNVCSLAASLHDMRM
jgi:protein-tyrosine phosphatase